MNPYSTNSLARVIYEERVREGLARNAARRDDTARTRSPEMTWATRIGLPRLQAVARSLIAAFLA